MANDLCSVGIASRCAAYDSSTASTSVSTAVLLSVHHLYCFPSDSLVTALRGLPKYEDANFIAFNRRFVGREAGRDAVTMTMTVGCSSRQGIYAPTPACLIPTYLLQLMDRLEALPFGTRLVRPTVPFIKNTRLLLPRAQAAQAEQPCTVCACMHPVDSHPLQLGPSAALPGSRRAVQRAAPCVEGEQASQHAATRFIAAGGVTHASFGWLFQLAR